MTPTRKELLATAGMFAPLVIYLLALNPWFNPEQHDDVLYYFGATALLGGEGFSLGGTPITDWPPVLSAVLAGVMKIVGPSVWVAKLVVLGFIAAGIAMAHAVARLYGLPAPRAIAALTGLLPISLISGAAVLSEWPFLALSLAFFWALARLLETRSWRWAVAVGVLLAFASLTRFIGVFLGVAIVVQAWHLLRRAGWGAVLPEGGAALIGAVPWLLWKWRCQSVIASGDAPSGAYDDTGYYLERFSHIEPLQLLSKIEAVLLSAGKVADKLLGAAWPGVVLGVLVGGVVLAGIVLRIRAKGFSPVDGYVLVCLLLLLGDLNKPERYFVPLAPFLIGYLLTVLSKQWLTKAVALWAAWLLALDGYLLFVGNSDGARGGFSMLASRRAEDFYRGEFRDLYLALRWAGENAPPGRFEVRDHHGKYALAFAGRDFEAHAGEPVALVARAGETPEGWRPWREFGTITVYRR